MKTIVNTRGSLIPTSETRFPVLNSEGSKKSQTTNDVFSKRPSMSAYQSNDKILVYTDSTTGKNIYHKLDFSSPRTSEAAEQIGITFKDCILR